MAWEWVGPVATAVVGIGGMVITARVGRHEQRALDRRLWLETRRAVYTKYLSAVDALQHQAIQVKAARLAQVGVKTSSDLFKERLSALTDAQEQVILVAGDKVAELVSLDAQAVFHGSIQISDDVDVNSEQLVTGTQHHGLLLQAMRDELRPGRRWRLRWKRPVPQWASRFTQLPPGEPIEEVLARARRVIAKGRSRPEDGEARAISVPLDASADGRERS